jgi:Bacteriocin-protection, YdeI or OmpD-Associated/Domain of unknown function (DUF1905)
MPAKKISTTAILQRFDDAAIGLNMHYLELTPDVWKTFKGTTNKPVRCVVHIGKNTSWQCALSHLASKPGFAFITIAIPLMKKNGLARGMSVDVTIERDQSALGGPMAEELAELLEQDAEGKACFDALSPGKKRNILFFVGSAKTSNTRIDRAVRMIRNLKMFPPGSADIGEVFRRK